MSLADKLAARQIKDLIPYQSARRIGGIGNSYLNANESPYPAYEMPEKETWQRYPDFLPGDLVTKYGLYAHTQSDNVLITRGADEGIDLLIRAFCEPKQDSIVISPPTYAMYGFIAEAHQVEIQNVPLIAPEFSLDPDSFKSIKKNPKLVFLCHPNNPTGISVDSSDVQKLLDGIPDDVPVLIDEAYHHFVQNPNYRTAIPHVLEGRPVMVARTFSKIYGMAAIRLGYGIASPEMIDKMRPHQTGNVSVLARWGGIAALKDTESEATFLKDTLDLRNKTVAELEAMGHRILPSETNFFFVYTGRPLSLIHI